MNFYISSKVERLACKAVEIILSLLKKKRKKRKTGIIFHAKLKKCFFYTIKNCFCSVTDKIYLFRSTCAHYKM